MESIGDPDTVDPAWAYDTASAMLIFNVYDTLVFFDRDSVSDFVPSLATEWSINQPPIAGAPAGTDSTWYFKIRTGVRFHDGSTLTPADVEYSFERWMVQDRSGGPTWMINEPLFANGWPDKSGWAEAAGNPIDTAVESNSTHVWLNLAMPYPPLMQILCQSWASVLSQQWCTEQDDWSGDWSNWKDYADPENSPLDVPAPVMMGTGPYMFDYWTAGIEWSIVAFNDDISWPEGYDTHVEPPHAYEHWQHWPPSPAGKMVASRNVDRFTEKVVYEWGTRLADYLGCVADAVYVPRAYLPQMIENWPVKWDPDPGPPPPFEWNPEEYAPGIRCLPGIPTLQEANYFFNFDTNPATTYCGSQALDGNGIPLDFFSDINIRKGFAYSFNYTEFIEDMFWGEAEQPSSCVPEGILYHIDVDKYYLDYELARDYFDAASDDPDSPAYGVTETGFEMTSLYNTGNIPRETTAYMLKAGVEHVFDTYFTGTATITVSGVPWPTYLGALVGYPLFRSTMPLFIIGWLADYPDPHNWVTPYMHSAGDFSGFQSYNNPTVDALIAEGIATPDGPTRAAIYEDLQWLYYEDIPSVGTSQALGRHWEKRFYMGWYYNPIYPGLYVKHIWKGLNGDVNGDNKVDILDLGLISGHWYPGPPIGPLGYDPLYDIWPENFYGDIPKVWVPALGWIAHPSIGAIDVFDQAKISAHWLEEVG